MNLIILGGYSDYNKEWVENIRKTFGGLFNSVEILYYENWKDYKEDVDIRSEVENLKKLAEGKNDLVIFAKSVGVALTLQAIRNGYIKPIKCIFAGTAYEWSKENGWDMDELLNNFAIPSLFIQQTNDRTTSSTVLREVLNKSGVKNYNLLELPGEDHKYNDIQEIIKNVEPFIKNN